MFLSEDGSPTFVNIPQNIYDPSFFSIWRPFLVALSRILLKFYILSFEIWKKHDYWQMFKIPNSSNYQQNHRNLNTRCFCRELVFTTRFHPFSRILSFNVFIHLQRAGLIVFARGQRHPSITMNTISVSSFYLQNSCHKQDKFSK